MNVNQGDIVQRNTNLIEIADPAKFEANVLVTERDVTSVVIGGDAVVSFDALPDLTFPAKITLIAPLATIQQGVVNYKVTVELTSTTPITAAGSPGTSPAPITLKDGFAAVVNIPVQKKDNILIVPSRAISHQGQNYVVQVEVGTTVETRVVKIGITDFQNTEIIEGLNQGEKVVLPAIPTASPTPGGIFAARRRIDRMIRLSNIVKTYPMGKSELKVLQGVNLNVEKGEMVVVIELRLR